MKVGYVRVSKDEQNPDAQFDALREAGCERIFSDELSGSRDDRPGFDAALQFVREGDVLVCPAIDRLGRSLRHLVQIADDLRQRKVDLVLLREAIDTTTPAGQMIYHIFGALAQYELSLIKERTRAGLKAARARGRVGGRPGIAPEIIETMGLLSTKPDMNVTAICKALKISRSTYYKYKAEETGG